jgi:two-component system cell cycle sensor histidine kinase/response regulator CckA
MAMVFGLIKQHKGYISFYSEPGHGTTFRLYFPAVESAPTALAAKAEAEPAGGTERILVVDDEDGLRRSAARVLRRAGYTVAEAPDGESALALLSQAGPPFELVLSDVVMPRMGGLALHEELRKKGFLHRFIFMSGYTAEDVRALARGQRGVRFLHKPWSITDLLRRVRGVLDEPAPI